MEKEDKMVNGMRQPPRKKPAALDIPGRAALCLDHILENCDPRHSYVPFVGATLGEEPPHFVHHKLDWTEVLPYSLYGYVIARDLTGSDKGRDIELSQRRLFLSFFDSPDGLVRTRSSPWHQAYPLDLWEQARALMALLYWQMAEPEDLLLERIRGIVDGLFALSFPEGKKRLFPAAVLRGLGPGPYALGGLIDPLVKVYELTGSPKAFQLAEGIAQLMMDPKNGFFDEQGAFGSLYRFVAATVCGISRYAAAVDRLDLTARARQLHDKATSLCTSYGGTPCTEPACSGMELSLSALSLARLGHEEYWDQIERYAKNQIAESQFLDAGEWVKEKAVKGRITWRDKWVYEPWPEDQHILPYDDYRDVVQRCVGAFLWTSADEHMFIPASAMLCCAAHGLRTLHTVWKHALTEGVRGVVVDLHVTTENEAGEVVSYEPFAGKTAVRLRKDARLRVRIPAFARGGRLSLNRDGAPHPLQIAGDYADFGPVKAGEECVLEFELKERTTPETVHSFAEADCSRIVSSRPLQARWRGNTVVALSPEPPSEKRIYRRKEMDTDKVKETDFSSFIPSRRVVW